MLVRFLLPAALVVALALILAATPVVLIAWASGGSVEIAATICGAIALPSWLGIMAWLAKVTEGHYIPRDDASHYKA